MPSHTTLETAEATEEASFGRAEEMPTKLYLRSSRARCLRVRTLLFLLFTISSTTKSGYKNVYL